MFGPARRTWVLGGGGARGAAQVGGLQALFEAGVDPPTKIVRPSRGARDGGAIAPSPAPAGDEFVCRGVLGGPGNPPFRPAPPPTPLHIAVEEGAKAILAISLMGGGEYAGMPSSLPELIARTLQLSLHHQMLADYEQLRDRARIVVLCPVTSATATWEMTRKHLETVIESSRVATAALLSKRGSKVFRHSGIHYLELV